MMHQVIALPVLHRQQMTAMKSLSIIAIPPKPWRKASKRFGKNISGWVYRMGLNFLQTLRLDGFYCYIDVENTCLVADEQYRFVLKMKLLVKQLHLLCQ